ncbi:MAG TPA: putative glycoside hydrolase, partial [Gaiellaceae bacterium]|nr:putative glycoside hydrolase [Gaiellaceae bacterium]
SGPDGVSLGAAAAPARVRGVRTPKPRPELPWRRRREEEDEAPADVAEADAPETGFPEQEPEPEREPERDADEPRAFRALPVAQAPVRSRPPRERRRRARRPLPWGRVAVVALVVLVAVTGAVVAARAASPELTVDGPASGAVVGLAGLPELTVSAPAADTEWVLDGKQLAPRRDGDRAVWQPEALADGEHELVIRRDGRLFASSSRTIRFTVDTKAPELKLDRAAVARPGKPVEVAGTAEAGATLKHGERVVPVGRDARFRFTVPPTTRRFDLAATDAAGNTSRWRVPVTVVARRPTQPVRSVHVTAYAWADDGLREAVLDLVRTKRINAVQLDLKDESGEVGWKSGVPLAKQIGSQLDVYDLPKAVKQLHGMGVRVIGRIVCFRDPIHAQAAWKAGRKAEVIQAPDGTPYAKYGGFTNFAHPAVRKYNVDLAVAAAKLGVDEILYDYIRRPDGPIPSMVFPGLKGTPEAAIVKFLAESRAALAGTEALVGASVFGVAATRPTEVAQDIPGMAKHVDYIAPMLYPSHWGPGEYDVADPNGQPYDIVFRSTKDFVKQVRGTGARIVNWLQDFSYGRTYGPAEVQAQIKGSRDAGVDEFILWDAGVTYTAAALAPTAGVPALGLTAEPPKDAPLPTRLPDPKPPATAKPAAQPAANPKPKPAPAAKRPLSGLPPNELGQVPVVMHHMIRPDRVGEYDQTPAEFRAELEYLWQKGYAPVNAGDLLTGNLDVPKGTTPVVFTFDDATTYQIDFTPAGKVKPATAVGIMLEFARTHPGFVPKGTFYVNRTPFGSEANAKRALKFLVENGFEIGNHTLDHTPLRDLPAEEIQKQLATGEESIRKILPGYKVTSMALPLGSLPRDPKLASRGSWRGTSYGPYGVMLVGANPAPSPYSKAFDPIAIPRIRSSWAGWKGDADFAFSYWMKQLEQNPRSRYVSDGDVKTITVRKGAEGDVRPRFAARVRTA